MTRRGCGLSIASAVCAQAPHEANPYDREFGGIGVEECLPAVLWNGTVGLAPFGHGLPLSRSCGRP